MVQDRAIFTMAVAGRRTVAELRDIKVVQLSDFGLFSLYKTPKKYLLMLA